MSLILERRDIWALSRIDPWEPTIRWYAKAVGHLQQAHGPADPRAWTYLANMHGTASPPNLWPAGIGDDWNACQHGSWYFLPWHRIYLHHFEKIVRAAVVELQGPSDWALPFWNYNPADPETLALPPAFRDPLDPDGQVNPLFIQLRDPQFNAGAQLDPDRVETSGWSSIFSFDSPFVPTFGGPKTGWTHNGPANGQLETEPHGPVHIDIGGLNPPGLMSRFETAGRDPIFWLHHANIDRLWVWWRRQAGHANSLDADWLTAPFELGSGAWTTSLRVQDVLDTTADPLRYRYEGLPLPPPIPHEPGAGLAPGGDLGAFGELPMEERTPPVLAGASAGPIRLTGPVRTISVAVDPTARQAALMADDGEPRHVYLALENVTGTGLAAGSYVVHLNVPEKHQATDHPDQRAGRISTFGVTEASLPDDVQSGSGLTFSFDITDLVRRLRKRGAWDPDKLRVTITPDTPPGREAGAGEVTVGRVGVYYG